MMWPGLKLRLDAAVAALYEALEQIRPKRLESAEGPARGIRQFQEIALVIGTSFLTIQHDAELDARIRESRTRRGANFPQAWTGPNSWVSRFDAGSLFVAPIIARLPNARSSRVLEIGCGQGQKALSYSPFVGSVLGIDIDSDLISYAKSSLAHMGSENVVFDCVEANDVRNILASDKFDIIMLYAVLEHLTPGERNDLLSLLWEHISDNGFIFIGETPNRVSSFDHHTSHLPFVDSLNDDYYLRYVEKFSPREDWRPYVGRYQDRTLGSYRAGRGVSFHEFDLMLGEMGAIGRHIVWDSFSALPRSMYPLQCPETAILDTMRWQGNRIDQSFSRYWLEAIIAKQPPADARAKREFSLIRPRSECNSTLGLEAHGLRAYGMSGKSQSVTFDLPTSAHSHQFILDMETGGGGVEISDQNGAILDVIYFTDLSEIVVPGLRYLALDRCVAPGTTSITIRPADRDSIVVTGDLGVFGVASLGPLDPRTPKILARGNF